MSYRRHLDMHIVPYLGSVKLSKLTAPMVSEFRTKLREGTPAPGQEAGKARSPAMVKKIMGSLQPEHYGSNEPQCGKIVSREFAVARGDAPEVLQPTCRDECTSYDLLCPEIYRPDAIFPQRFVERISRLDHSSGMARRFNFGCRFVNLGSTLTYSGFNLFKTNFA
jgi:hypothetical protein